MTQQPDLFDVGERKAPERAAREVRACVPAPVGSGPAGQTCGSCRFKVATRAEGGGRYLKCELMRQHWTHGAATDIKAGWDACREWQPIGPDPIDPAMQAEFNRRALAEADQGAKWIGAKAIGEDMRRYSQLHSGTEWKINNSDVAALAANAEKQYPRLRGKFKHRTRKAE